MDNRKLILAFYMVCSAVLWFLSRSLLEWTHHTFYAIRRYAAVGVLREALPVVLAAILFAVLFRHARVNQVMDEVVSELKKVTWPTRDDVVKSTTVVLICILICSFILAGFDLIWGHVISYLLNT